MLARVAGAAHEIARSEIGQPEKHAMETLVPSHLTFQTKSIEHVCAYAGSVRGSYDTVCEIGIGGAGGLRGRSRPRACPTRHPGNQINGS